MSDVMPLSGASKKVPPVKLIRGAVHEFGTVPQIFDTDIKTEGKVDEAKIDFSDVKSTSEEVSLLRANVGESAPGTAPVKVPPPVAADGSGPQNQRTLVFLTNYLLIEGVDLSCWIRAWKFQLQVCLRTDRVLKSTRTSFLHG